MRQLQIAAFALLACMTATAAIPEGYYDTLDGKSGDSLKGAAAALADGHTVITYNTKTWDAFEQTDVRIINGREAWWDMYSNNIVWLPAHDALNIEHSVANSWWGGKKGSNEAYSDLFHLNPSDQNANNRKGHYPPGEVEDPRILDNGLLLIGTPESGQGGGATSVFEPADEYKGDFARAYFYVFTTYASLGWLDDYAYAYADGELQPWARDVLLSWHRADPVDSKEMQRNDRIYELQQNRNPFIDYPQLAEYIWGEELGESFSLSDAEPAEAVDRPEAPVFGGSRLTGVNTYSRRWWDGFHLDIQSAEGAKLLLSVDGADYYEPTDLDFDPAPADNSLMILRTYSLDEQTGLRSSISTLRLEAHDPTVTDYSLARWEKVMAGDPVDSDTYYLLLSSNTLHAMGTDGGTSTTAFMQSAGFVEFDADEKVVELPTDAAIVSFHAVPGESGKYSLAVSDTHGNYKGSWNATAKNKMALSDTYTPATFSVTDNSELKFEFDQYGSLQFNKTQPRFLNYESKQTPIYLYRFLDFEGGMSAVETLPSADETAPWAIGVEGNTLLLPEGARVYDLNGRMVTGRNLAPGVYIVTGNNRIVKIRI